MAVLGVVLLMILAVVLIFNRGSNGNTAQMNPASGPVKLSDYARKPSKVRWTQQGPLVSQDERRAVRITVSADERTLEILSGYEQTPINGQTLPNTQAAYETFLQGLARGGFVMTRKVDNSDSRGVCPFGHVFLYELTNGGQKPINSWSDSCAAANGPFAGQASTIRRLFQAQIPTYNLQIRGLDI
jgi:hypothetical protein